MQTRRNERAADVGRPLKDVLTVDPKGAPLTAKRKAAPPPEGLGRTLPERF